MATDTAALAPATRTAAGQRALITALRLRVAQQQELIAAQPLHDARLAAIVRSLGYGRTGAVGGGVPLGGMPFGGGGFSGGGGGGGGVPGLSGLSGLSSVTAPWRKRLYIALTHVTAEADHLGLSIDRTVIIGVRIEIRGPFAVTAVQPTGKNMPLHTQPHAKGGDGAAQT